MGMDHAATSVKESMCRFVYVCVDAHWNFSRESIRWIRVEDDLRSRKVGLPFTSAFGMHASRSAGTEGTGELSVAWYGLSDG
jgi:hypothetical protein